MARFQRGSLRVESRKNGQTWVLRYFVTGPQTQGESSTRWSSAL